MRKRNFLVPVDKKSGLLVSRESWWSPKDPRSPAMVPNFEIDLRLFLNRIIPTNGSFRAVFQDTQGHEYCMMGADFNELLSTSTQIPVFDGTFTVAHKSYDYTIRLVDPVKDEPLDFEKMSRMADDYLRR
jgi:hypothetical protein